MQPDKFSGIHQALQVPEPPLSTPLRKTGRTARMQSLNVTTKERLLSVFYSQSKLLTES